VLDGTEAGPRPLLRGQRSAVDASASARLELLRDRARQREESAARVREQLGPHGMSRKGLARRDARIRRLLRSGGIAQPETLSVLLIRIAFREDRSGDLTAVTTDGNFQLEPAPEDTVIFDPPPHDKQYFESHMRGLAEYWGSMSNGLIRVQSRVLPEGDEDAYFLSDIADYGPGAGRSWTVEMLEKLVRDMILEADRGTLADGSVRLADYDFDDPNTYIIFAHAGADLQSNLVFQEGQEGYSPNDIPTFFVSLGDSARVQLESVDSDSGTQGLITECSVIPETTNQDGLAGSISAALMHEFGHALGLPDLYSTLTGLPTIGYWGIMDSGTNLAAAIGIDSDGDEAADRIEIVTGLLPPAASAWTRWYLGFTEEIRVGSDPVTVDLPASYRQDTREKVLRLDVSPEEFFLVENRWIPPVSEGNWALYSDPETGVVLYLGDFDAPGPEPRNTHLYDFFMPFAGGLQVWRVRQDRVEAFDANNSVQAYRDRLGVELIEADGIQDVGVFDFNTRGFVGSDDDSFRDLSTFVYETTDSTGAVRTETITYPRTSTELTPDGLPNSRSTFRIPTGVRLSGIGPSDRQATRVTARIEGLYDPGTGAGFPVELPDAPNGEGVPTIVRGAGTSPVRADLDGEPTVLVAATVADSTAPSGLYAYAVDGSPRYGAARVADLAGEPAGPLAVVDGDVPRVVTASHDGVLEVFSGDVDGVQRDDTAAFGDSVDVGPLVLDTDGGTWLAVGRASPARVGVWRLENGSLVDGETGLEPGGGGALRSNLVVHQWNGVVHLAAVTAEGVWTWNPTDGDRFAPTGESFDHDGRLVAWPDGDDDRRLVFADTTGAVLELVRQADDSWTRGAFGDALDAAPVGDLVVADLDGDGRNDLVLCSETWISARHGSGVEIVGFPKRLSDHYVVTDPFPDEVGSGPLVADVDADGRNEVAFVSTYGLLQAVDTDGGPTPGFPKRVAGGGVVAPLITDLQTGGGLRRAVFLFDALGDTLGSGRRLLPARLTAVDLGPRDANADPPSEWLMRGGSARRSGRGTLGSPAGGADAAIADAAPVVWPNPVRGETGALATIRFFSGRPHQAELVVYNLEGQEVRSVRRSIQGDGIPDAVEFDTTGLHSGAYLCRLDYVGADGRTTDVMTLYIER
jgi:M6 family metalloprotease-like protein